MSTAEFPAGTKVILTLEATADGDGTYRAGDPGGYTAHIDGSSSFVRSVERAPVELPAGLGAVIEARIPNGDGRIRLVRVHRPPIPAAWAAVDGIERWISDAALTDVVVLDAGLPDTPEGF